MIIVWKEARKRKQNKMWNSAWIRWSELIFAASAAIFSVAHFFGFVALTHAFHFASVSEFSSNYAHTHTTFRFLSHFCWNVEYSSYVFFSFFLFTLLFIHSFCFHLISFFFFCIYLFITDSNARQREDKTCGDPNGKTKSRRYRNQGSEKGELSIRNITKKKKIRL